VISFNFLLVSSRLAASLSGCKIRRLVLPVAREDFRVHLPVARC